MDERKCGFIGGNGGWTSLRFFHVSTGEYQGFRGFLGLGQEYVRSMVDRREGSSAGDAGRVQGKGRQLRG